MKNSFVIFALVTLALLSYGLYMALEVAPTEATMGDVQRIFYYHVPSAWAAFLCFAINAVASIWYLAKRGVKSDAIALASADQFGGVDLDVRHSRKGSPPGALPARSRARTRKVPTDRWTTRPPGESATRSTMR